MKIKLLLIILIGLLVASGSMAVAIWVPQGLPRTAFVVAENATVRQIAEELAAAGVIRSAALWRLYVRSQGLDRSLVAGEHALPERASTAAIARALTSRETLSNEVSITLIEGWTARQMGEYLIERGLVTSAEWEAAITVDQWREEFDFLAPVRAESLEGFLFPDTYQVFRSAGAQEIVRRLLQNFDRKLTPQMRTDIAAHDQTIFDVVTLASIVEREARGQQDQRIVADIFWKRLAINMALQSDATLTYLTGKNNPSASYRDLEIDSPYNTYKYPGLPPGPIANPGQGALEAVVYPQRNPYYYFLTDPQGTAYYAETFEGHQANRARYLR